MKQSNNTILQHTSIILIQTDNNSLKHPTKKGTRTTSLTNNNYKEILPNILTLKEIPNNNSRYSYHPSNKIRNRKIDKKEIKVNSRMALKKSSTKVDMRRTLPDNEILINEAVPQEGQTQKNKLFGHSRTLEVIDGPT